MPSAARIVRGLGAALLTGCAACGGRVPGASGSDSLYVGLAVADAPNPAPYRNAVALALEVLNASRAPEELPLAIREASHGEATPAAVARTLRDDPDVVGVVGHARDAATREATPIYGARRPVVALSPTSTNPATATASDWVFRLAPAGTDVARAAARYAADSITPARAALVYPNDEAGRAFVRAAARIYDEAGGLVTERDPYLDADESVFAAYAQRIARRGAGVAIVAGGPASILAAARALYAAGGGTALVAVPEPWEELPARRDTLGIGLRVVTAFHAARPRSPAAAEFVASYTRRFAAPPVARAALAYDAATLIGLAVREAGPDRRAVRDWIARIGRGRPAHAGVTGSLVFDGFGNPANPTIVIVDRLQ